MAAVVSFNKSSWQMYKCGFSLDNLVRIQFIQTVLNSLRSVLK